jgi:hypothetical protein
MFIPALELKVQILSLWVTLKRQAESVNRESTTSFLDSRNALTSAITFQKRSSTLPSLSHLTSVHDITWEDAGWTSSESCLKSLRCSGAALMEF